MQGLIEILEEQAVFGFTGRINIVLQENRQYQGMIAQKEGLLIDARYKELRGRKALFAALIDDLQDVKLKFIVEPELIEDSEISLSLNISRLKKEFKEKYDLFLAAQKLRPPDELRLLIDADFITKGPAVGGDEFTVLCMLTEYNKVGDIFEKTPLLDYEITGALVSLRKKGALKVFKN